MLGRTLRQRGIAILIIEHLMRVISELADRVVMLDRGAKIADGPAASVLTDQRALDVCVGDPTA